MVSIMEDEFLTSFQWLQLQFLSFDKYLSAMINNCSIPAVGLIVASLLTALVTWMLTRKDDFSKQLIVDEPGKENIRLARYLAKKVLQKNDGSTDTDLRRRKGMLYGAAKSDLTNSVYLFNRCIQP